MIGRLDEITPKELYGLKDQIGEEPIEQAPYNAPRPGGPAKIEGEDREQLFEQLQPLPTESSARWLDSS